MVRRAIEPNLRFLVFVIDGQIGDRKAMFRRVRKPSAIHGSRRGIWE